MVRMAWTVKPAASSASVGDAGLEIDGTIDTRTVPSTMMSPMVGQDPSVDVVAARDFEAGVGAAGAAVSTSAAASAAPAGGVLRSATGSQPMAAHSWTAPA